MFQEEENEERPCLHCLMVELVGEFCAEHQADTDEVIDATAKMIAEFTSAQDRTTRQKIIETLMRQIMSYDKEFREEDAVAGSTSSLARH